ncbi:hypothetical protein [Streptomyces sp. NPDC008317]|uniref:hypothetical protein n=1 Tax=Streptomyces sp. NPDC008317 TaxID=3364827 RepID=UPI0036E7DA5E
MKPMSKEELCEKYPDVQFQAKLFRLTSMSEIIAACLIANNFRPSKDFYDAIKLTPYGDEKVQQLIRKKIPYQEARLYCFLEFSWVDLLVDVSATDDTALQSAIGEQIRKKDIFFPFTFGRELYDRAFRMIDLNDETATLTLPQTLDFLDATPQGVFQVHDMVTGPFGLLTSQQKRFFSPERHPGLMHCSDVNCSTIHQVHLSTSQLALINKHRPEMVRLMKKESETPSAWGSFLSDLFSKEMKSARDDIGDGLIPLIGDALTDDELRRSTAWLLDNTKGRLRSVTDSLSLRGRAEDITKDLSRAEMMQLCLSLDDRDIVNCLDTLVFSKEIKIPTGEYRVPIVNVRAFGKFHMMAEIGPYGVHLLSHTMNLAPLRLRRLIESMYRLETESDREELEWQLREEEAESLEAKLDIYLQKRSPERVLTSLVLARKSNAITACEVLGLRDGASDDPDFISLILWKLGFASQLDSDPHAKFWRLHDEMEKMVRSVPGSPLGPTYDDFRGTAANYFVELESILDDSLCFTSWALTNDHVISQKPFVYQVDHEINNSHNWLQGAAERSSDNILEYGENVSLYGLCRGFQVLGGELIHIASERENYRRSVDQIPEWAQQQDLQKFPFLHTVPYLDLTDEARTNIASSLHYVSKILVNEEVYLARNDWLHGRRNETPVEKMRTSLQVIKTAIQMIEDSGFARIPYAISKQSSDGHGRSTTIMTSTRGFQFSIYNPNQYEWLKLPGVGDANHVMNAAVFSAPNHVLRFQSETSSPYTRMWADYPKRKPRSQRAIKAIDKLEVAEE